MNVERHALPGAELQIVRSIPKPGLDAPAQAGKAQHRGAQFPIIPKSVS